jgi:hypothetical protein
MFEIPIKKGLHLQGVQAFRDSDFKASLELEAQENLWPFSRRKAVCKRLGGMCCN